MGGKQHASEEGRLQKGGFKKVGIMTTKEDDETEGRDYEIGPHGERIYGGQEPVDPAEAGIIRKEKEPFQKERKSHGDWGVAILQEINNKPEATIEEYVNNILSKDSKANDRGFENMKKAITNKIYNLRKQGYVSRKKLQLTFEGENLLQELTAEKPEEQPIEKPPKIKKPKKPKKLKKPKKFKREKKHKKKYTKHKIEFQEGASNAKKLASLYSKKIEENIQKLQDKLKMQLPEPVIGIEEKHADFAEEELVNQHSEIQTLKKQLEDCHNRRSELLEKNEALRNFIHAAMRLAKLNALEDDEPPRFSP